MNTMLTDDERWEVFDPVIEGRLFREEAHEYGSEGVRIHAIAGRAGRGPDRSKPRLALVSEDYGANDLRVVNLEHRRLTGPWR